MTPLGVQEKAATTMAVAMCIGCGQTAKNGSGLWWLYIENGELVKRRYLFLRVFITSGTFV